VALREAVRNGWGVAAVQAVLLRDLPTLWRVGPHGDALIRHLPRSEGLSQRAIARQLGIARDTESAALASDSPLRYAREAVASAINAVAPRIRALIECGHLTWSHLGCRSA